MSPKGEATNGDTQGNTQVARSRSYRLVRPDFYRKMNVEKTFPQCHKIEAGGQAVAWWADEVEAWQKGEWKAPAEVAANDY